MAQEQFGKLVEIGKSCKYVVIDSEGMKHLPTTPKSRSFVEKLSVDEEVSYRLNESGEIAFISRARPRKAFEQNTTAVQGNTQGIGPLSRLGRDDMILWQHHMTRAMEIVEHSDAYGDESELRGMSVEEKDKEITRRVLLITNNLYMVSKDKESGGDIEPYLLPDGV